MKITKKTGSLFALAMVFLFAFGKANAKFNKNNLVKEEGKLTYHIQPLQADKSFILSLQNDLDKPVKISIYNSRNKLVFTQVEKSATIRKKFNLKQMGLDDYTIKLEAGDIKYEEAVKLKNNQLSFELPFDIIVAPDQHSTNKINMGFANAKESVVFTIFNESGDLVYENTYTGQHAMSQVFNLEKLPVGHYDIVVRSGTHKETITYTVIAE